MTRLFRLATVATVATLLLIVLGGASRAAGGAGCGPDWPSCRGSWLPPLETGPLLDYLHRAVAASVGLLVLATLVGTLLVRGVGARARSLAWGALLLVVGQSLLGGVAVWLGWPAWSGTAHLAAALGVFALTLSTAVAVALDAGAPSGVGGSEGAGDRRIVRLARAGALAALGAILSGAAGGSGVAIACTSWPLCPDAALRPIAGAAAAGDPGARLAIAVAGALAVAVAWMSRPASLSRPVRLLAGSAVGLAGGAWSLGAVPIDAVWSAPAALAALTLLWAALVAVAALADVAVATGSGVSSVALGSVGAAPPPSPGLGVIDAVAGWLGAAGRAVRDYVALTKPGILSLLLTTTLGAMLIAAAGVPPFGLVLATLLGGALAAGGANVLNCYLDRDIDARMPRTRHRATVAGRIGPAAALAFGLGLTLLAVLELGLLVNWPAAGLALAGNLFYVLVYTRWLKRTTPHNIVIGGAAGAVPPLVGWAAITGGLAPLAWGLFAVIFFWTPPHFWALALLKQGEYGRAAVPMLPNVAGERETRKQVLLYAGVLAATCLALVPLGLGPIYLVAAAALNALFLWLALRLWLAPSKRLARRLFFYSLWYLAFVFAAAVADRLILG